MTTIIDPGKLKHLDNLTEVERRVFYDLLSSTVGGGGLDLSPIDRLYDVDYSEIPVSVDKFITDPAYMGDVYDRGRLIYPFWREFVHNVFHDNPNNAYEIALSGAIGTGKSTIASLMMSYMLYRTMCLKNPQKFYELTSNSPIVFVVLNLTLDLAYDGLYSLIVESIKLSPWFQKRVDIRGKYNYAIEFPNNIQLMVGSNTSHTIGKNVLCLTGDTVISTTEGEFRIDTLDGHIVSAISLASDNILDTSVPALVSKTGYTRELVHITLRDHTVLRCTKDHRWMLSDMSYKEAGDLVVGDSLKSWESIHVLSVETVYYDHDIPVYDVINAYPHNNFLVKTSTDYIVSHNCAIMDEVNFSKAPKGSKNSVMDMYRNIRRRMESRFLKAGRQPGLLTMISSKNSEYDFLEQYIQSVKYQQTTWVVDRAVYEIKPASTYLGPKFKVAVGDKTRVSAIITSPEDEAIKTANGYEIIEVPIEYKSAYTSDINEALKEISGISAFSTNKLLPYAGRVEACIDIRKKSPFELEVIQMGMDSEEDIRDYISNVAALRVNTHRHRFIHVDIGLKGDKLGIVSTHVSKETVVERYTPSGGIDKISENVYSVDFALAIQAVSGSEIPLYKVREFIAWLNSSLWKIDLVTFDGFQSADSIQLLNTSGIKSKLQSVDRSEEPYLNLRACILENRLIMSDHSLLKRELYDLEYDRKNKKIDHPIVSYDGLPGSKDLSDALAGSLYGAQVHSASLKGQRVKSKESYLQTGSLLQKLKDMDKPEQEDISWI